MMKQCSSDKIKKERRFMRILEQIHLITFLKPVFQETEEDYDLDGLRRKRLTG